MTRLATLGWGALLLGLGLTGAGCRGTDEKPATPAGGEVDPLLGPSRPAQAEPPAGHFTTHWDILCSRYLPDYKESESFAQPCYQTDHLRLELLRGTASGLPAPERPAAEVLIAVEGEGTLQIDGLTLPFVAGQVAVLPVGARGALVGKPKDPLLCVAFRERTTGTPSLARPAGVRPVVREFQELYPHDTPPLAGVREEWVAGLPGISLHVLEVVGDPRKTAEVEVEIDGKKQPLKLQQGYVTPYQRRQSDQMLFFLHGAGSLGLSNGGNLVKDGSLAGIPNRVTAYYANGSREPTLALIVLAPGTQPEDPQADYEMQFEGPARPWKRPVTARQR